MVPAERRGHGPVLQGNRILIGENGQQAKQSLSQPASLRLALMEALEVRSCRSRLRAMCRIIAKFSGALPVPSVAGPHPAFVLPEGHLQHPMDGIPDAPMATGCPEQPGGIQVQAGYIAPGFHRRPVSLPPLRRRHPDAAQPRCCSAPAILFRNRGRTTAPNRQSSNNGESQFVRAPCRWSGRNHASFSFSNPVLCPQENRSFTSSSSLPWFSFTART